VTFHARSIASLFSQLAQISSVEAIMAILYLRSLRVSDHDECGVSTLPLQVNPFLVHCPNPSDVASNYINILARVDIMCQRVEY